MEEEDGCGVSENRGMSGSAEVRSVLKQSFDGYDTDKDGFITYEEVAAAWRRCLMLTDKVVDEERVQSEALVRIRNMTP